MKEILDKTFLGNTVLDYCILFGSIIFAMLIVKIFHIMILRRLKKAAEKTESKIDDLLIDLVNKILMPLVYIGIFYVGLRTLHMNEEIARIIKIVGTGFITWFVAYFVNVVIDYGSVNYARRQGSIDLDKSLSGIIRVTKVIIWVIAISFFLDNLGFEISAVVAGLGVGGVAVALAAQAVLGDLFSYFAILFDKPFKVGDFIIVDDYLGTVEKIGIKTTRICSLGGEQLIFSNTDLTNSRVRNYKRMDKRRVVFKIGVTYQTTAEKVQVIPSVLKSIIEAIDDTVFDRAHFFQYGDFSLIYEIVYYVVGSDYNKYMDIQQKINFSIKDEFERRNIEFAYPTQTLFVTSQNS